MVALDDQIYGCLRLAGDRAKDSKKRYETAIYSYHGRAIVTKHRRNPCEKKAGQKAGSFFGCKSGFRSSC
jgi:hypothetical protein